MGRGQEWRLVLLILEGIRQYLRWTNRLESLKAMHFDTKFNAGEYSWRFKGDEVIEFGSQKNYTGEMIDQGTVFPILSCFETSQAGLPVEASEG